MITESQAKRIIKELSDNWTTPVWQASYANGMNLGVLQERFEKLTFAHAEFGLAAYKDKTPKFPPSISEFAAICRKHRPIKKGCEINDCWMPGNGRCEYHPYTLPSNRCSAVTNALNSYRELVEYTLFLETCPIGSINNPSEKSEQGNVVWPEWTEKHLSLWKDLPAEKDENPYRYKERIKLQLANLIDSEVYGGAA